MYLALLPALAVVLPGACRAPGSTEADREGQPISEAIEGIAEDWLTLVLDFPSNFSGVHHGSGIRIRLTNEGSRAITIVVPGDGSVYGLRTPILEWIVTSAEGADVPQDPPFFCDTINAVEWDELVELEPGASAAFDDWLGFPRFPKPGTYFVSLWYTNDPLRRFERMGESSLEIVRTSTPCSAVSAPVRIEVP